MSWKEAEFNKTCFDFYVKYYNEKYGVNSINSKDVPQRENTQSIQNYASPSDVVQKGANVEISRPISRSTSASVEVISPPSQPNSAQNIVARKLLTNKSKVDTPTPLKPSESAVTATKNKSSDVINVPKCNSLGLLSVYSDSEEENEEIAT